MAERPPKILVVDDVRANVRLLEAVLVPRGYEVLTLKGFRRPVAAFDVPAVRSAAPEPSRP